MLVKVRDHAIIAAYVLCTPNVVHKMIIIINVFDDSCYIHFKSAYGSCSLSLSSHWNTVNVLMIATSKLTEVKNWQKPHQFFEWVSFIAQPALEV